jgi:RNA polymerase sigma-70 factor (ECF subfamily)
MRSREGNDDAVDAGGARRRRSPSRPAVEDRPASPTRISTASGFEALYRAERSSILAVAAALVGDWGVAEDVVQESFAEAYLQWKTVGRFERPGAWVRRVAINKAISRLRRRGVETRVLGRVGLGAQATTDAPVADAELWETVRGLPRRQAQVVALTYIMDLTMTEVADVLGCSEGSVKTHLHRARERLAREMPDRRTPGPGVQATQAGPGVQATQAGPDRLDGSTDA